MAKRSPDPKPTELPSPPAVPLHEQCPCCFHGLGGRGRQYGQHPPKSRVYYACDKCGHTWSADLKIEAVAIDHRLPPDIEQR